MRNPQIYRAPSTAHLWTLQWLKLISADVQIPAWKMPLHKTSDPWPCDVAAASIDERNVEHKSRLSESRSASDKNMIAKKLKSIGSFLVADELKAVISLSL